MTHFCKDCEHRRVENYGAWQSEHHCCAPIPGNMDLVKGEPGCDGGICCYKRRTSPTCPDFKQKRKWWKVWRTK